MPVITICGVSYKVPQLVVTSLKSDLKRAVAQITELSITASQITVHVPLDGSEETQKLDIVIRIDHVFAKQKRTPEVLQKLRATCMLGVAQTFPFANIIECGPVITIKGDILSIPYQIACHHCQAYMIREYMIYRCTDTACGHVQNVEI